ncbi:unnamed protein product [Gadus morhua 'NCC']
MWMWGGGAVHKDLAENMQSDLTEQKEHLNFYRKSTAFEFFRSCFLPHIALFLNFVCVCRNYNKKKQRQTDLRLLPSTENFKRPVPRATAMQWLSCVFLKDESASQTGTHRGQMATSLHLNGNIMERYNLLVVWFMLYDIVWWPPDARARLVTCTKQ